MTSNTLDHLKYPIGKFVKPDVISETKILEWIEIIEGLPEILNELTKDLLVEQLNLPYRPDGWNIKQVVHHLADSHMNCMIRFKWTLTEDTPTIKAYHEDRWTKLKDDNDNDLSHTLLLLKGLHAKLGTLMRSLTKAELKREFIHPEQNRHISLEETIGIYAWHSKHHVAHIEQALKFNGKF